MGREERPSHHAESKTHLPPSQSIHVNFPQGKSATTFLSTPSVSPEKKGRQGESDQGRKGNIRTNTCTWLSLCSLYILIFFSSFRAWGKQERRGWMDTDALTHVNVPFFTVIVALIGTEETSTQVCKVLRKEKKNYTFYVSRSITMLHLNIIKSVRWFSVVPMKLTTYRPGFCRFPRETHSKLSR